MKIQQMKLIVPAILMALMTCTTLAEITVKIRSIEVDDNVYTPYFEVETEQDHDQGASQR